MVRNESGFGRDSANRIEKGALGKYVGLRESLNILNDHVNEENRVPKFGYEEIVRILAADDDARKEAIDFLKHGGPKKRDSEAVENFLGRLGWSIVDELVARNRQSDNKLD